MYPSLFRSASSILLGMLVSILCIANYCFRLQGPKLSQNCFQCCSFLSTVTNESGSMMASWIFGISGLFVIRIPSSVETLSSLCISALECRTLLFLGSGLAHHCQQLGWFCNYRRPLKDCTSGSGRAKSQRKS
jgi:hypothetical protein